MVAKAEIILTGSNEWWQNQDQFFVIERPDGSFYKVDNKSGNRNIIKLPNLDQVGLYKTHHVVNDPGDVEDLAYKLPSKYPIPIDVAVATSPRIRTFFVKQFDINTHVKLNLGQYSFSQRPIVKINSTIIQDDSYFINSFIPNQTANIINGENGKTGLRTTSKLTTPFAGGVTFEPINGLLLGVKKGGSGHISAIDASNKGDSSHSFSLVDSNGINNGVGYGITNDNKGFVYVKNASTNGAILTKYDFRDQTSPNWLKPVKNLDSNKLLNSGFGVALEIYQNDVAADMDYYKGFIYHHGLNRIYKINPSTGESQMLSYRTSYTTYLSESLVIRDGIAYVKARIFPANNKAAYYAVPIEPFIDKSVIDAILIDNDTNIHHSGDFYEDGRISDSELLKNTDRLSANNDEEIKYNINLKNTSVDEMLDISVQEKILMGTSFRQNSLYVNGIVNNGDLTQGINIPSLERGRTLGVQFSLNANRPLTEEELVGETNIKYSLRGRIGSVSNILVEPSFKNGGLIQEVDKEVVFIEQSILYTTKITNTGNVEAVDIIFIDTFQKELEFVSGTLKIDDREVVDGDLKKGILIESIGVNQSKVVTFELLVKAMPSSGMIVGKSVIRYNYIKSTEKITERKISNITNVVVMEATNDASLIASTKSINNANPLVGSNLSCSVILQNNGKIKATDIMVKDILREGLEYIQNSAKLDDILIEGDIINGFQVGEIEPLSNKVLIFEFLVVKIPKTNPFENIVTLTYKSEMASKTNKIIGEVLMIEVQGEAVAMTRIFDRWHKINRN